MKSSVILVLPIGLALACGSSDANRQQADGIDSSSVDTGPVPSGSGGAMVPANGAGAGGNMAVAAGGTSMEGIGGGAGSGGATTGGATTGGATTGGASTGGAAGSGEGSEVPEEPLDGAGLYSLHCSTCHGESGEGKEMLGPEIQHSDRGFATWMVRNGRPGADFMGPMLPLDEAALSLAELELILDFLQAFPKPTTGEGLYLDYCSNCHGADASGGAVGHDLLHHANFEDLLTHVRAGNAPGEYGNRTEFMPAVAPERLSDEDIQLIADFVAGLAEEH